MKRDFHPVADLFPLMEGTEFNDLVADIRDHGLREPIWLHQDGRIVDGRNRYRACIEAGVAPEFQTFIGPDQALMAFNLSMNLKRRHLNDSQRSMVADRLATLKHGRPEKSQICGISQSEAAQLLSVSKRSVETARKVLSAGSDQIIGAVDAGNVAVSDAASVVDLPAEQQNNLLRKVKWGEAKNLKAARRKAEIQQQRDDIETGKIDLPEGVFEVIVIDPPWPYGTQDQYDSDGFRGGTPYPEESIENLSAREIPAAENCVLWLWTTHKFMRHTSTLLDAWGFEEKVILTWVKDRMGTGRWLRSRSEFCIMAVKGKPRVDLTNQTTVLNAPLREHSRKPAEFYALVDSLCIGRKLDYFSREARPGWEQYGDEPGKFEGVA